MAGDSDRGFVLGIDIGTTSLKVSALDLASGSVVESKTRNSHADVPSDVGPKGFEQDVTTIFSTLEELLTETSLNIKTRTKAVAVTGQMHGIVLWNGESGCVQNNDRLQIRNASRLITWQDQRCTEDFLASLPSPQSALRLATGHGCASLFWLKITRPQIMLEKKYDCAGTVMDLLTSAIAGKRHPVTSDQLAASFGYFSTEDGAWNSDLLRSHAFPVDMLPEVRTAGSVIGRTTFPWCNIPEGVVVLAGLGDLQCAVTSVLDDVNSAVLNVSTSLQLAVPLGAGPGRGEGEADTPLGVEVLPYLAGRRLAVAASLNGGNVLAHLVRTLTCWLQDLGVEMEEARVWERLISQAESADASDGLHVQPLLYGERHLAGASASISGIRADNSSMGAVFRATCRGLVENVHSMMSADFLRCHGVSRILGTGSVVTRIPLVLDFVRQVYGHDLQVDLAPTSADSAAGAAKVAALTLKNLAA